MFEVLPYHAQNGVVPFLQWLNALRDRQGREAILSRLVRVQAGNFGDCKPVREGVWELRLRLGPGYRVYYARHGAQVVLLLCGGDKGSQQADIEKACEYWRDWQTRQQQAIGEES